MAARKASTWDAGQKAALLARQQDWLFERGEPGRDYLRGRGLDPSTWIAYGLGFNPNAMGKGPAISIPWYRGGGLVAIRYRLLEPANGQKIISEPGSRFGRLLFGGQVRIEPGPDRALFLCEGEINAMSIYQASDGTVDVLSLGSESARLTDAMIAVARKYGAVAVWADRATVARQQALALGAGAITSPYGQDANDLLQAGLLGEFVTAALGKISCSL